MLRSCEYSERFCDLDWLIRALRRALTSRLHVVTTTQATAGFEICCRKPLPEIRRSWLQWQGMLCSEGHDLIQARSM